jgi:hypothetical protein
LHDYGPRKWCADVPSVGAVSHRLIAIAYVERVSP